MISIIFIILVSFLIWRIQQNKVVQNEKLLISQTIEPTKQNDLSIKLALQKLQENMEPLSDKIPIKSSIQYPNRIISTNLKIKMNKLIKPLINKLNILTNKNFVILYYDFIEIHTLYSYGNMFYCDVFLHDITNPQTLTLKIILSSYQKQLVYHYINFSNGKSSSFCNSKYKAIGDDKEKLSYTSLNSSTYEGNINFNGKQECSINRNKWIHPLEVNTEDRLPGSNPGCRHQVFRWDNHSILQTSAVKNTCKNTLNNTYNKPNSLVSNNPTLGLAVNEKSDPLFDLSVGPPHVF
jgi:hypothetical protein